MRLDLFSPIYLIMVIAPASWLHPKVEYYHKLGHGDKKMAEAITADIRKNEDFEGKGYSMRYMLCSDCQEIEGCSNNPLSQ